MRRALTVKDEVDQIAAVERLTTVFEGIASIKISRIRDSVLFSKSFFNEVWQMYSSLRINPEEQMKRQKGRKKERKIVVAITSEGRLSGGLINDVKSRINEVLKEQKSSDLMVLGAHGYTTLEQAGISVTYAYSLPNVDQQFDVQNIVDVLRAYSTITVIYQTYESLRVQKVVATELIATIQELGGEIAEEENATTLSSENFMFEPSIALIADQLEALMIEVALTQMIMESKLAQYASRFNAMNRARHKAFDMKTVTTREFFRAKRSESDERLKETMKMLGRV